MRLALHTNKIISVFFKRTCSHAIAVISLVLATSMGVFAQPGNDDPCNAIPLTPATTCTFQVFDNSGATSTTGVPAPGCANFQGNDVWFQVVVPAASNGSLRFDTEPGSIVDGGMAIYRGDCTTLQLLACDDDGGAGAMPRITITSLTVGSTIWVRVWEYGGNVFGTFGICVSLLPPAPVNDEPCNAITLVAQPSCIYQTFTTLDATGTIGAPAPGCANYLGGDVWFQVVVPCDGSLTIDTQSEGITDGGLAAYRGTCTTMQLLDCDDDGSVNGLMPSLTLTSLTPGSTIWLRFWEFGNDNPGTFGICVGIPPPTPPGANCFGAQGFCSDTLTYPSSTNVPSLGGGGMYGCLATTPNPAWYYLQIETGGIVDFLLQQTNTSGGNADVDFVLWGPFPTLPSACNNLSASNIVDCSYSTAAIETVNIPNAQAGDFYVLLITNWGNVAGTITFNQSGGSGSTDCSVVCQLETGDAGPVCSGASFDLSSSTVPNAAYSWVGPNCFTSNQQNPTGVIAPTLPGTYYYVVTATTATGSACFAIDTVQVIAAPQLGIDSTVSICPATTFNLTSIYNTTGLSVNWTSGGNPIADSTAVSAAGVYQLIAINAAGCRDTALVTIGINNISVTATSTGNATCVSPGEITVSNPVGTGPFEYGIDSNPGVFQSGTTFTADPGTYNIIIRDALGCLDTSSVTVGFIDDLTLSVNSGSTICSGQSATLTATSAATSYAWTPPTGLSAPASATTLATPQETTTYTVIGNLGPCADTATVTITIENDLQVEAGGPLSVTAGGTVTPNLVVTGTNTSLSTISWTPPQGLSSTSVLNPVITPVEQTGSATYQVTVTNTTGCNASDELVVNINNVANICQNVRNAFSPNGDGNNDLWKVYDDFSCLTNVTVQVYNRYGSKVFESRDYRNAWDGRYSGKAIPDGTYYAVVTFSQTDGKKTTVKTDLTIIR